MAFMRYYGMQAGDPKPRPVPKRKSAGSGPRVKAQRKRVVRTNRKTRGAQGGGTKAGKGVDVGAILAANFGRGVQAIGKGASALKNRDIGALIEGITGKVGGGAARGGGGGGGKRRSINPTNVKALRRSLRRFEGFGNLVKRVNKMLPASHHFHAPALKVKKRGKR